MKAIRNLFLCLSLILLLPACAPSAADGPPSTPSDPAPVSSEPQPAVSDPDPVQPVSCDGFGPLRWGAAPELLFEETDIPDEGIRVETGLLGWACGAYYQFHPEKGLYAGSYRLNEGGSFEDGVACYQTLRRGLLALYGEHGEMLTAGDDGKTMTAAPTIDEVAAAGEGQCMEVWGQVPTTGGMRVMVSLELTTSGEVRLSFFCSPTQL